MLPVFSHLDIDLEHRRSEGHYIPASVVSRNVLVVHPFQAFQGHTETNPQAGPKIMTVTHGKVHDSECVHQAICITLRVPLS